MNEIIEIINSDTIQAIGTVASLYGVSLKDLNIKNCYNKIKEVFSDTYYQEIDSEQREILFNSLVELEEYITKDNGIDSKLFEEQIKIAVNGIKLKDELTKEYIKLLRNVSFLDLKVFKILFSKVEYIKFRESELNYLDMGIRTPYSKRKNNENELRDIPKELINRSIDKLIEVQFLKEKASVKDDENEDKIKIDFKTELGKKIIELLV